jgi:hypothetical protein
MTSEAVLRRNRGKFIAKKDRFLAASSHLRRSGELPVWVEAVRKLSERFRTVAQRKNFHDFSRSARR